jgi:hypothetical protein
MKDILREQVLATRQKLEETKNSTLQIRKNIQDQIDAISKISSRYEASWAGDWTENSNLYHKNFNQASRDGMTVDEKFILQDIKRLTNFDLNEIKGQTKPLSKVFFELKDYILSELSFIKGNASFQNEIELITQIEKFKWGMSPGEYTRSRRPQHIYVHDPTIINRGLSVPPHIAIADDLIFTFSLLASYENFEKLAHRLIRQLEIKVGADSDTENGVVFNQQAIRTIIDKFHIVATQLKNRYNSKSTIIIEDEYDVQDLMNALLRINFEDVRKEEYTPSYAGGATRVDFLLKREKILIEVKKTRPTLKDKEVGNQLIIDIAHYSSHPDCKTLICFVYDPDSFIVNPRGLEDDLNKQSNDEMIVEVYVRP